MNGNETSLILVRVFFWTANGYSEVHSFHLQAPEKNSDIDSFAASAAEQAFTTLNVDHPLDWAHRSMSVGDVVVVAETALLCGDAGWERIDSSQLLTSQEVPAAVTRLADQLRTGDGTVPQEILDDLQAAGITLLEATSMIVAGAA